MKTLELESCTIPLYISGKQFLIRADKNFADTLSMLSEEAGARAAAASREGYNGTLDFLSHTVDSLLGEGAVADIFVDDEPDVFALCEIISYVCDCFAEYRRSRISHLKAGLYKEVSA